MDVEPRYIFAGSTLPEACSLCSTDSSASGLTTVRDASRPVDRRDNQIRIEIVTTPEQLLHAYAIRAICFMEEHGVSARQTYDGNDYQATHFIAYAADEPIGTARIRWFKDFAKME